MHFATCSCKTTWSTYVFQKALSIKDQSINIKNNLKD